MPSIGENLKYSLFTYIILEMVYAFRNTNWIYNFWFFCYIRREINRLKSCKGLDWIRFIGSSLPLSYTGDAKPGTPYSYKLERLNMQHSMKCLYKPLLLLQAWNAYCYLFQHWWICRLIIKKLFQCISPLL